ncbi:hypothetical protein [Acidovorax sp. 62]|uniref:hypothetical protein n=1 Tax=Acidovorax sp. 62 TaxID=2035203 RepID=UPI0011787DEF|nr:hypothetical protein [Acidovorax sp. 62]
MLRIIPPQATIQKIFLNFLKIKDKTENKTRKQSAYLLHQGALTGAAQTAKAPAGYRQHGALAMVGITLTTPAPMACSPCDLISTLTSTNPDAPAQGGPT